MKIMRSYQVKHCGRRRRLGYIYFKWQSKCNVDIRGGTAHDSHMHVTKTRWLLFPVGKKTSFGRGFREEKAAGGESFSFSLTHSIRFLPTHCFSLEKELWSVCWQRLFSVCFLELLLQCHFYDLEVTHFTVFWYIFFSLLAALNNLPMTKCEYFGF